MLEAINDSSILSGLNILILMALFIGLVKWAWSSKRKARFNQYAAIPLDDSPPDSTTTNVSNSTP